MDKYVGKRLDGRYEIREIIGVGGMAVVYKAYDAIDDRMVAIKILKEELLQNQEFRRRFKNESKAIAVLSHPNIVKVYDVSLGDRIQYIVMEYIDGITLKEYIKSQGTIRWKDALHFAEQVLKALQHAHDKGIVHRDIKPQNMMVLPDGTIKVTDFGIARFSRSEHRTMTDKAIGSVHYISPEQARGEVTDEKTDLYSVGVFLYEMLTGRLPFDAENAVSVAIMQLQNEPIKPRSINPAIPEGLEEIILRAMQKNRGQRYQSAAEMLKDIEQFKLNPSIQFEYKYFVDPSPTKFVSTGNDFPDPFAINTATREEQPEEEEEETKKSPVMPILIGITIAIILAAGFGGTFAAGRLFNIGPFAVETKEVPCPELVGKVYEEIKNDDEFKEFSLVLNEEYSNDVPAGQIIRQNPEPGKPLRGNREITVTVSLGPKSQTMGDYVGMSVNNVKEQLGRMGIPYKIQEVFNEEYGVGFVVATTPEKGKDIKSGQEVTIMVSKGAPAKNVVVGNYANWEVEKAKQQIVFDGLTVGAITTQESAQHDVGMVISQSLEAGTEVPSGSPVTLVVSSGRPINILLPVPNNTTKSFVATMYYNGQKIYTSSEIDPTTLAVGSSGYREVKLTLSRSAAEFTENTANIMVKYNDQNYIEYHVNFDNGQYMENKRHDLILETTPEDPNNGEGEGGSIGGEGNTDGSNNGGGEDGTDDPSDGGMIDG